MELLKFHEKEPNETVSISNDGALFYLHINNDTVRYDFGPGSNGVWHHFVVPLFATSKSFDRTIEYLSTISNLAQSHDIKGIKDAYEASPDKNKSLWEYVMAHEYNKELLAPETKQEGKIK